MKISWRLHIISILVLISFLFLMIYHGRTSQIIEKELKEIEKINQFNEDISKLTLNTEYLIANKQSGNSIQLEALFSQLYEEVPKINDFNKFNIIKQALEAGEKALSLIFEIDESPENHPDSHLREELRQRAIINLRAEFRQLMSLSYTISSGKLERIQDLQNSQRHNFALVMVGVLIVITLITFWNIRHILNGLNKLCLGAAQMAQGNLEQRITLSQKDELDELAGQFNQMAEKLEKRILKEKKLLNEVENHALKIENSNKELEQFAYVVSHDLQEPLRMISSFLKRLEDKYNEKLDDKARQYIHFAVDGAMRMRRLILDLLEFSRVGRHEERLQNVDLKETLRELAQEFQNQLKKKSGTLQIPENLPVIKAYPSPIRQVFQNLISNSIKYQKECNQTEINITWQEDDDFWEFCIQDNGIGIEPDYHEKIFELFQRLHNRESYSGTGIGLAIVHKNVAHLGGEIRVFSELDKGSKFVFTISKKLTDI